MKKAILPFIALIMSINVNAGFFDDVADGISRLGKSESELCTEEVNRLYGRNKKLISGCNKFKSRHALKCLDTVIRKSDGIHPEATNACSFYNDKISVKNLQEFSSNYEVKIQNLISLSFVNTKSEATCMRNFYGTPTLNQRDLETCLDESIEARNTRDKQVLGFVTVVRTEDGSLADRALDFFEGLFN